MHHPPLTIYTCMACMFSYCASRGTCPTKMGIKCVDDCMLYEGGCKCQMMTVKGKSLTVHCSSEKSQEHSQEHEYTSLFCEIDDEYYLCQVEESLGYCGNEEEKKVHYTSFYGVMCSDTCGKHDESYFWCHTPKGWDYCSIKEDVDYQGHACREDHPCGKRGENYYWCMREDGGPWGYCGPVEAETLLPNCPDISEGELHYNNTPTFDWPYIASYWYKPFLKIVKLFIIPILRSKINLRHKRQGNDEETIVIKTDEGNCKEVILTACKDDKAIADGYHLKKEIKYLIAQWDNGYLRNQAKSELISSKGLRIDNQGMVNRGNQRYYNLQIQLNVPRNNRESTTVSQALIPMDHEIPTSYVRRAFLESFTRRAKVTVEVRKIEQCKNRKNKKGNNY